MILIAEQRVWKLGPYVVRQTIRPDNPYWPAYLIFRRDKLVGRQFSNPSESDCQWLEYLNGVYATKSHAPQKFTTFRGGRPTNAERARRASLHVEDLAAA